MRPIFKTEMLIYHSKVDLDGKILFGKIKGECWYGASYGTRIPHSMLVHSLLTIEIQILFLELTK